MTRSEVHVCVVRRKYKHAHCALKRDLERLERWASANIMKFKKAGRSIRRIMAWSASPEKSLFLHHSCP